MRVKEILEAKANRGVLTITQNQSIHDAIAELAARRVGVLVVSSDGASIDGILSERDIVRELGQQGIECLSKPVGELMTGTVISCQMGDASKQVLETMTDGRFRHMPVVDDGKLVGVITLGDVVKARLKEMDEENSAMVDMIRGA